MRTLYKTLLSLVFPLSLIISCDNESPEPEPEPCEIYATGIYNETFPGEVPEKYWPCMDTKDLVDAGSYNFNSGYQLMAGCCGLQSGYDLCKSNYSWYEELESRDDAFQYLLAKYISIDTVNYDLSLDPLHRPGYKFYTYNLEVLLAQKVYLEDAKREQKIALINELIRKQEVRNAGYTWGPNEGTTFVMARTMYYSSYNPFLEEMDQNILIKNLVELGDLYRFTDTGHEAQLKIFSLIDDYLEELNTK
ncbi:MAG: hypothetical protein WAW07_02295 [Bacteroidales bacterium]